MKTLLMCVVCGLLLMPAGVAVASPLVYKPLNPFFGGDTFNAQWLLASADAQNRHIERAAGYTAPNPMDDFKNSLNRALLSRLTTKILDEAFGETTSSPLKAGQYVVGDYTIDIVTNGAITVNIKDILTGNTTTVSVPYY
jgi:curli production assembly/transport component CsgF